MAEKKDPPQPPSSKKPWEDGEFDAEKAWNLIKGLRDDKATQAARIKELEEKVDAATKAEDGKKSDIEQLTAQVAKLNEDLEKERHTALRAQVASEKGLTAAQARRLNGKTREELEADADDLLESFPAAPAKKDDEGGGSSSKRPPSQRPTPDLKGGSEPDDGPMETNPAKLAESLPRY